MEPLIDGMAMSLAGSILGFLCVYVCMRSVKLPFSKVIFAFLINWCAATIVSSIFGYSNIVMIVLAINVIVSFAAIKMLDVRTAN